MVVNRRQTRKKIIRKAPLHQRILGKSQVELDLIVDLTDELEKAYSLDLIEYDDYLRCHDALTVRREKAKRALDKAIGIIHARPTTPTTTEHRRSKHYQRQAWQPWQVKLLFIVLVLISFKIFCK